MIAKIPLSNDYFAIIDIEDLDKIAGYGWYRIKNGNTYYARAHKPGSGRKNIKIYMHRLIMNAPSGADVDHIDRNGLNNCRDNLRLASRSANRANAKLYKNNKTGFRGVGISRGGKYTAFITRNKVSTYLGTFQTPEMASTAYINARATIDEP